MSGRADVWMPLYVADYLKDTQHLSTAEHGAYLLLIFHAWTNSGMIPRSDSQLARIARLSLGQWKRMRDTVLAFWIDQGDAAQTYMHKRISAEIDRTEAIIEKRRKAGSVGASKRWQTDSKCHADAIDLPMANGWQTDGQSQSQSQDLPTEGKSPSVVTLSEAVLGAIWDDAPPRARQRSSKADLRKALLSALKRGGEFEAIRSALRSYWASPDAQKDGGDYVKGIHRMIEADRWQDWAGTQHTGPADGPNWADRAKVWRELNRWNPSWGPLPGEPGCGCPADLLEPR